MTATANIPLDKVFVKQRLDLLTADAWMLDDARKKQEVVALSVATGVPCAHTVRRGCARSRSLKAMPAARVTYKARRMRGG